MRARLGLLMPLIGLLAAPAVSQTGDARLEVFVTDADAIDSIVLRNAQGCGPLSGALRIDFAPSDGGVVIDTLRGGGGTLYPATPEVIIGLARVRPVADGAREISILFDGLDEGMQIVVTLDIDSGADGPGPGSVVATGPDIAGSLASFAGAGGDVVEAVFDATGAAVLEVPDACAPAEIS